MPDTAIPTTSSSVPDSPDGAKADRTVSKGIALNMVQKWLGHAQLTTTAIYADAVGDEEQSIAAKMW
jgi:integrase